MWFTNILFILLTLLWIYCLRVCRKAELTGWFFLIGSVGSFFILYSLLAEPSAEIFGTVISYPAVKTGDVTGLYTMITGKEDLYLFFGEKSYTVPITAEGNGFTELCILVSVMLFFEAYTVRRRLLLAGVSVLLVTATNALRILSACLFTALIGDGYFYIIHDVFVRLAFFVINVTIYYRLFTRPHVNRITIGNFNYGFTEDLN